MCVCVTIYIKNKKKKSHKELYPWHISLRAIWAGWLVSAHRVGCMYSLWMLTRQKISQMVLVYAFAPATWTRTRVLFPDVLSGCSVTRVPVLVQGLSFWNLQQRHISDSAWVARLLSPSITRKLQGGWCLVWRWLSFSKPLHLKMVFYK